MEVTSGSPKVAIGLIDSPVATNHPDLAAQAITDIGPSRAAACRPIGTGRTGVQVTSLGAHGRPVTASHTSAAAPFVTGATALLCAEFSEAPGGEIKSAPLAVRAGRPATAAPPLIDARRAYHVLRATRPRRRFGMTGHINRRPKASPARYRVRLPGFVGDQEIVGCHLLEHEELACQAK